MKICKGWLQALLSSAPRGFAARSRVLARPVLLAQTGELASRLGKLAYISYFQRTEINATKLEKTPIHFKSDVFTAVTFVDAKIP